MLSPGFPPGKSRGRHLSSVPNQDAVRLSEA